MLIQRNLRDLLPFFQNLCYTRYVKNKEERMRGRKWDFLIN